jgi:hypothetical protein
MKLINEHCSTANSQVEKAEKDNSFEGLSLMLEKLDKENEN